MVLEDGGIPITMGLKSRDPFRTQECTFSDVNCMVDTTTDCSQQDKVYIITCNGCMQDITTPPMTGLKPTEPGGEARYNYVGMTGTSMHARAKSHAQCISSMNKSNALAKHVHDIHNGTSPGFTMKPMASYRTVLRRYKGEGVLIEKQIVGSSLNGKIEGGRGGLVRLNCHINRC